ncbi:unnamed protein product [Brassica oleracea]
MKRLMYHLLKKKKVVREEAAYWFCDIERKRKVEVDEGALLDLSIGARFLEIRQEGVIISRRISAATASSAVSLPPRLPPPLCLIKCLTEAAWLWLLCWVYCILFA